MPKHAEQAQLGAVRIADNHRVPHTAADMGSITGRSLQAAGIDRLPQRPHVGDGRCDWPAIDLVPS